MRVWCGPFGFAWSDSSGSWLPALEAGATAGGEGAHLLLQDARLQTMPARKDRKGRTRMQVEVKVVGGGGRVVGEGMAGDWMERLAR